MYLLKKREEIGEDDCPISSGSLWGEARTPAPCLPLPPKDDKKKEDKVIKPYRRINTDWMY